MLSHRAGCPGLLSGCVPLDESTSPPVDRSSVNGPMGPYRGVLQGDTLAIQNDGSSVSPGHFGFGTGWPATRRERRHAGCEEAERSCKEMQDET